MAAYNGTIYFTTSYIDKELMSEYEENHDITIIDDSYTELRRNMCADLWKYDIEKEECSLIIEGIVQENCNILECNFIESNTSPEGLYICAGWFDDYNYEIYSSNIMYYDFDTNTITDDVINIEGKKLDSTSDMFIKNNKLYYFTYDFGVGYWSFLNVCDIESQECTELFKIKQIHLCAEHIDNKILLNLDYGKFRS